MIFDGSVVALFAVLALLVNAWQGRRDQRRRDLYRSQQIGGWWR